MNQEELLNNLYNAFDPRKPLPAGDPAYVDCKKARGDGDVLVDLGQQILRSQTMTCQLYSGHRGGGKSTELLRLKQYLEEKKFFVVDFAADEKDIDAEDTQYTDILLGCTRHILERLKDTTKPDPLLNWLKSRWQELKDLALSEVEFDKLDTSVQITQFAKLTANLRAVPSLRSQIRAKVNPHTVTLIEALNQFISEAKRQLPNGCTQLAVIADNLDRIVPIIQENNRTNQEEIFIDRCEQLKALDCHIIYTVPISMIYSKRAIEITDIYGSPQVLPMIMIQTRQGEIYPEGMNTVKEIIRKRVGLQNSKLSLETDIFESVEVLERLCLMSGGDMRNLILLTQVAIQQTATLPISKRAVQRSITQLRDIYRKTVEDDQWEILADVSQTKTIRNNEEYRPLLFNRCILEYCYYDEEDEKHTWNDVHPLIRGIPEFKQAVEKIKEK
ncbi:MAG: ATP-binding protein [Cyanobacteria bacterium J06592_8]